MVGPRENFSKLRFSEGLKNAILRLEFINTIFHKRAMLLIFYAEYTASFGRKFYHWLLRMYGNTKSGINLVRIQFLPTVFTCLFAFVFHVPHSQNKMRSYCNNMQNNHFLYKSNLNMMSILDFKVFMSTEHA